MASLAVTFGSFGDIVVVVQLVNQLYNTLNGIAGVTTAIQLLARRLQLYKNVLADVEDVLCRPESSLKPRTRAGIEDQLKGCHDTLLALSERITPFTVQLKQLRPRGPRRPIQLFMLAVLWQHIHARKVAALRAQLDEHFSVLRDYLTISQCNNQEALLAAAKDNRVSTTKILSIVENGLQHAVVGASVMQLHDWESNTYYEAVAVVPMRMLAVYLQPMISLMQTCISYSVQFSAFGISRVPARIFTEILARELKCRVPRDLLPRDTDITIVLKLYGQILPEFTTIFQCRVFSPAGGEPHALLGVPPSHHKAFARRVFSDVLQGKFSDQVDAGLYEEEESLQASYAQNGLKTYYRAIDSVVGDICMPRQLEQRIS